MLSPRRVSFIYRNILCTTPANNLTCPPHILSFKTVLAQALGEGHEDEAEADTFYCFTNLMSEVRSLYVKDMDKEDKGIYGSMRSLTALINEIDLEIGEHLAAIGVSPEFYAFRWLTTLGSREFDLPVSELS